VRMRLREMVSLRSNKMTRTYTRGCDHPGYIAPPPKDELVEMYIDKKMNRVDVGRVYGVSSPTIKKWLQGYDIHIRNNSEAHIGLCVGHNNHMYGKHHSIESKAKTSASLKGKMSGRDNPMWKGGVGEWHDRLRKSPAYKNWRKAVFERDHFTCQMCGDDQGGNLQAHHVKPIRDNRDNLLLLDVNNGVTLCKDCHLSINKREYDFVGYFGAVIGGGNDG